MFSNANQSLDFSIMSDCLEPSFVISSPQNVTIRSRHQEKTLLSLTLGLLTNSITVSRSGHMSGPMKQTRKFTVPLPTVSDDKKSDQASPISISSGSSPETPKHRNNTFTSESPTISKPSHHSEKALVFVLAQKKVPTETPPSPHKRFPQDHLRLMTQIHPCTCCQCQSSLFLLLAR